MAPKVLRDHLRERHRLAALPSSVDHRWGSPRLHVPRVAHVGKGPAVGNDGGRGRWCGEVGPP